MFCDECGAQIPEGKKYCPRCGTTYREKEKPKLGYDTIYPNFPFGRFAFFLRVLVFPIVLSAPVFPILYFVFDIKLIIVTIFLTIISYLLFLYICFKNSIQYYDKIKIENDEYFVVYRNLGRNVIKYRISSIAYATKGEHPTYSRVLRRLYEVYSIDGIKLFEAVNGTGIEGMLSHYDIEIRDI